MASAVKNGREKTDLFCCIAHGLLLITRTIAKPPNLPALAS
jgi:hypothetical protein